MVDKGRRTSRRRWVDGQFTFYFGAGDEEDEEEEDVVESGGEGRSGIVDFSSVVGSVCVHLSVFDLIAVKGRGRASAVCCGYTLHTA